MNSLRIAYDVMQSEFYRILCRAGLSHDKALVCAKLFADNSLDGVYTHGVNRFPRFVEYIQKGYVKPDAEPICKHKAGGIEQWDGQSGPGPLNAILGTTRAMQLAAENGIGCVALANTNHWMRGGSYGWKAASEGYVFIGWTNTIANTPAWGATDARLGNNPLVIAMPFENNAIVLDMAMSQYSYGSLELHKLQGKKLPVPGGYDANGKLTDNPEDIINSRRILPIGYWKGAGLSLLLDVLATVLSGGLSTAEITKQPAEYNLSQVFIAINLNRLGHYNAIERIVANIIADYHQSVSGDGSRVRYPGERVLRVRAENTEKGIPVLKSVWDQVKAL
jgi:3-dehydro-L-gulonate 2-dehydrogenase